MKKMLFFALLLLFSISSCSNGHTEKQNSTAPEINEEVNKAKESLKFEAEISNKILAGKQIDVMTRADSVFFDGKNLVYTYEIDENYATIEQLQKYQKETMEKSIRNALEKTPQVAGVKENLMKIDGKVIYNYVGSSSKEVLTIAIGF
ncbi:MAG: hypothetical protein IKK62_05970 [Bacteroidaceae bacterium]|nr:hypothetical protein [Bacteroidaceae bacterium]